MLLKNESLPLQALKNQSKKLIVIAGPTAVGKTALSLKLAMYYNTVVLSADSRQFYRQMTIGTAKPNEAELSLVQHYFINNKNIDELYGAGHYAKEADLLLEKLFEEHDKVIVVGGSGLYLNALLNGVDEFEEVPKAIRDALNEEFEKKGLAWLQNELLLVDHTYYHQVDLNNPQRIIRALEVYKHSGRPFSSYHKKKTSTKKYNSINVLINTQRSKLYENINHRVDKMILDGLVEEVKNLSPYRHHNALKTVGYSEIFEFLDNKLTLNAAIEKIKQHTRNYAKRQLTWFKNQTSFETFEPNDLDKIIAYIDIISNHD